MLPVGPESPTKRAVCALPGGSELTDGIGQRNHPHVAVAGGRIERGANRGVREFMASSERVEVGIVWTRVFASPKETAVLIFSASTVSIGYPNSAVAARPGR